MVPLEGIRHPKTRDKELDITGQFRCSGSPQGEVWAKPLEGDGGL